MNFEDDIKNNIQEITFTESEFSECKIILVKNDTCLTMMKKFTI